MTVTSSSDFEVTGIPREDRGSLDPLRCADRSANHLTNFAVAFGTQSKERKLGFGRMKHLPLWQIEDGLQVSLYRVSV